MHRGAIIALFFLSPLWCDEFVVRCAPEFQEQKSNFYTNVCVRKAHQPTGCRPTPNIQHFTAEQFAQDFSSRGCSEKEILSDYSQFMSDEFVAFAKTLPGYVARIISLHESTQNKSKACKARGCFFGGHCAGLTDRIEQLHRDLQDNQRSIRDSARIHAARQAYEAGEGRIHREISLSAATLECANKYGISQDDLCFGPMNAYEYQLQTEFVSQLGHLSQFSRVHIDSEEYDLLLDAIGQGVALGIVANKEKEPRAATRLVDFGWELLEVAKGITEGVGLGAWETVRFAGNVACLAKDAGYFVGGVALHPVESAYRAVPVVGKIVGALSKVVTVPFAFGQTCSSISAQEAYDQAKYTCEQVTSFGNACAQKLKETSYRTMVKHGTALATEWVLTGKVFSLCHSICTRAGPILARAVQTLREQAALEVAVVSTEGMVFRASEIAGNAGKEIIDSHKKISGKELFRFTPKALGRMKEAGRRIPIRILDDIIRNPLYVLPDPRGTSNSFMYYARIWVNKKLYNVEILYDKSTNTIGHFLYRTEKLGPLLSVK